MSYRIQTPKDDSGKYKNNQLCTYNLPQPKKEHVYIYLFPDDSPPSIEKSNNEKSRCLDSLQFEHIIKGHAESSGIPVITCGDEIDKRIDGRQVISDITITFRSNEKVRKSGADFLILKYFASVCLLVPLHE